MEIFGRTIEHNREYSLPISNLVGAMVLAVAVSYLVGYLLIDVLGWMTLTPGQANDGYVHVFRFFAGALVLALPMIGFTDRLT